MVPLSRGNGIECYAVQRGDILWMDGMVDCLLPYGRRKDISLRVAFESVVGVCTYF